MKTSKHTLWTRLLCLVLTAALALCVWGCQKEETPETPETPATSATTTAAGEGDNVRGEGATAFTFQVVDGDGKETVFEIHTDKTTVGDALQELGLIEGEEGAYGLYVKKVNGITADYDVDGTYWAFYVNGEYASSGADTTDIVPGATYAFKVEK